MLNVLLPHRHVYLMSSLHGAHGLLSWQVNQHKWPHINGNSHGRPQDGIGSRHEVRCTVIRVFPQGQNFCRAGRRRQISHAPGWQTLPHSWLPQSRILPHRLPQLYPPTTAAATTTTVICYFFFRVEWLLLLSEELLFVHFSCCSVDDVYVTPPSDVIAILFCGASSRKTFNASAACYILSWSTWWLLFAIILLKMMLLAGERGDEEEVIVPHIRLRLSAPQ